MISSKISKFCNHVITVRGDITVAISPAANAVLVRPASVTIEITGSEGKVCKFLDLIKTFGIQELTRTGKVALARK